MGWEMWMICMWYCFCIDTPSHDVSVRGLSSQKADWKCHRGSSFLFLSNLHTNLRIISRSVTGLVTDSPCGVWGCGWATCLLFGGSLLGLCFWMTVNVIEMNLLLISCVCSNLYTWPNFAYHFSSEMIFYIKYLVLWYSVDVVSILTLYR